MQWIIVLLLLNVSTALAGGMGKKPEDSMRYAAVAAARYVCFDGRALTRTTETWIWNARRGCFISTMPCPVYEAGWYGQYNSPARLNMALARCRHDYPFRLGEMQTH